jgi:hypothetical protein
MKEYCEKSRNLYSMQEWHVFCDFCPSDGISSTPPLPSANADIMATSNSSLPVFPRLKPLKDSLVPCSGYGDTRINGRGEGRVITGTFKEQAPTGFHVGTSLEGSIKRTDEPKTASKEHLALTNTRRTLHHEEKPCKKN